jgi:predicted metal-dependent peptidase
MEKQFKLLKGFNDDIDVLINQWVQDVKPYAYEVDYKPVATQHEVYHYAMITYYVKDNSGLKER